MPTNDDLKCHIALTILSDISGWSNAYKAETVKWYMARDYWPYLAHSAIKTWGYPIERLNERQKAILAEYRETIGTRTGRVSCAQPNLSR